MSGKSKGAGTGVNFNSTDYIRNTVNQVLNDSDNKNILVLNLPMSAFESIVKDMQATLTLIKNQTGKVFLPICISHSPIKPMEDFIIVFRCQENIHAFPLENWVT